MFEIIYWHGGMAIFLKLRTCKYVRSERWSSFYTNLKVIALVVSFYSHILRTFCSAFGHCIFLT